MLLTGVFLPPEQHALQKKVARLPLSCTTLVCKVSPTSCDQHNHGEHPSILQSWRSSSTENLSSEVQVVLLATVQWKGIRNIFVGIEELVMGVDQSCLTLSSNADWV